MKHWIHEVIDGGKLIKLEDESVWEITFIDRIHTVLWLPMQRISITKSNNIEYPYKLFNLNMKKAVSAKPLESR